MPTGLISFHDESDLSLLHKSNSQKLPLQSQSKKMIEELKLQKLNSQV